MSKRIFLVCAILLAGLTVPSLASYSDLVVTVAGFSDNHVTIVVLNPNSTPEAARAQLTVTLSDGTQQTLTSPDFTLDGGATATISLTSPRAIVGIGDDPQPIGFAQ